MKLIDLQGSWLYRLDPENKGLLEKWFTHKFTEEINLPSTLDEQHKSYPNTKTDVEDYLTSNYKYEGKAWYQKNFTVTVESQNKNFFLYLERTKKTSLWLNDIYIGDNDSLATPHIYSLGKLLPGEYTLTVLVDNYYTGPVLGSHMMTVHTQGNWNGIIGEMYIYGEEDLYFDDIQIHPNIKDKNLAVKVVVNNLSEETTGLIGLKMYEEEIAHHVNIKKGLNHYTFYYPIIDEVYWSEFEPNLVSLTVSLLTHNIKFEKSITFGIREFTANGHHFYINGKKTFMRGKVDCCVFPLTGYPPMDVDSWLRIFKIAKSYGINLYRFHSWCPPKAAFIAADLVGMYLQPELYTFYYDFVNGNNKAFNDFQLDEGLRILKTYGNHPSFVMFAYGNENVGSEAVLREFTKTFKTFDKRRLYAQGSNSDFHNPHYYDGDDYWTMMRTDKGNIRASFSHSDLPLGYLQIEEPSTIHDYHDATFHSPVPVMSHEIGQYQFYPRFEEINKYTGVMHPYNLKIFKKRVEEKGLLNQAQDFLKANGQLAISCYREDIEAALRTDTLAGFQLLDIQDFPGQGTALVGILDAFLDSKGLITPEKWREFCAEIVMLCLFDKYVYKNKERFKGTVKVANYSPNDLKNFTVNYRLISSTGKTLTSGTLPAQTIPQGALYELGKIDIHLDINHNEALTLELYEPTTGRINSYPLWVFTELDAVPSYDIKTRLDEDTITRLENGERVLMFYQGKPDNSIDPFFTPDFWNHKMFSNACKSRGLPLPPGSLGLLINDKHPIFQNFPTTYHSDFHWFNIVMHARPLILDGLFDYIPIIQTIDNINRNHRLGILMEFKVGYGKLLVSTLDFTQIIDKIEVKHFINSLHAYLNSEDFNPTYAVSIAELKQIFN